ncbi:hypothetical protein H072_10466 [Dactylellina haptotyla CBS 200.50]|uniref:Uncharacterized protein n=1 Tax=Dactylellina haptotyla (strain CBS 200.50) TaxID=1284197 RepID=S8BL91_DACHA|nr:hypothetical protein H072_10466 [Dactylellina haptotyla CBS 200.50]
MMQVDEGRWNLQAQGQFHSGIQSTPRQGIAHDSGAIPSTRFGSIRHFGGNEATGTIGESHKEALIHEPIEDGRISRRYGNINRMTRGVDGTYASEDEKETEIGNTISPIDHRGLRRTENNLDISLHAPESRRYPRRKARKSSFWDEDSDDADDDILKQGSSGYDAVGTHQTQAKKIEGMDIPGSYQTRTENSHLSISPKYFKDKNLGNRSRGYWKRVAQGGTSTRGEGQTPHPIATHIGFKGGPRASITSIPVYVPPENDQSKTTEKITTRYTSKEHIIDLKAIEKQIQENRNPHAVPDNTRVEVKTTNEEPEECEYGVRGGGGFIPESYAQCPPPYPFTAEKMGRPRPRFGKWSGLKGGRPGEGSQQQMVPNTRDRTMINSRDVPDIWPQTGHVPFIGGSTHPIVGPAIGLGGTAQTRPRGGMNNRGPPKERRILHSGVAMNLAGFVPSKARAEDSRSKTDEETEGEQERTTGYILKYAFELGAGYDEVHKVYARRYNGDENNEEGVRDAIIQDTANLTEDDLSRWAGMIAHKAGVDNDWKQGVEVGYQAFIKDNIKRFLEGLGLAARDKVFMGGTERDDAEGGKKSHRRRDKGMREYDGRLGRAEKATFVEICLLESGLVALEKTGKYKGNKKREIKVTEIYNDLVRLEDRLEELRGATRDVLENYVAERNRREGTRGFCARGVTHLKNNSQSSGGIPGWGVEDSIESALSGVGALVLGYIDSEDDGEISVKIETDLSDDSV